MDVDHEDNYKLGKKLLLHFSNCETWRQCEPSSLVRTFEFM
jgi:hypothetical protein